MRAYPHQPLLDNNLSDTVNATLSLHLQGLGAEAIAAQRELRLTTIYGHFADAIEVGLLEPAQVLALSDEEHEYIINTFELLEPEQQERIKPLYDALNEEFDYGVLRCVLAGHVGAL
ncbi:MAG: helix-turn-helix domain-containing protein [Thiolinea sp.]